MGRVWPVCNLVVRSTRFGTCDLDVLYYTCYVVIEIARVRYRPGSARVWSLKRVMASMALRAQKVVGTEPTASTSAAQPCSLRNIRRRSALASRKRCCACHALQCDSAAEPHGNGRDLLAMRKREVIGAVASLFFAAVMPSRAEEGSVAVDVLEQQVFTAYADMDFQASTDPPNLSHKIQFSASHLASAARGTHLPINCLHECISTSTVKTNTSPPQLSLCPLAAHSRPPR